MIVARQEHDVVTTNINYDGVSDHPHHRLRESLAFAPSRFPLPM